MGTTSDGSNIHSDLQAIGPRTTRHGTKIHYPRFKTVTPSVTHNLQGYETSVAPPPPRFELTPSQLLGPQCSLPQLRQKTTDRCHAVSSWTTINPPTLHRHSSSMTMCVHHPSSLPLVRDKPFCQVGVPGKTCLSLCPNPTNHLRMRHSLVYDSFASSALHDTVTVRWMG